MFLLPGVTSFPLTAAIMARHPASDVLSVPVFMTLSIPDLLLTKIMVNEDDVTLKLSNSGEQVEQYYVYASGVQKAVYTNLTEAIARAYEERGNVIDSKENILWKCIYADYAQVAGCIYIVLFYLLTAIGKFQGYIVFIYHYFC